MNIVQNITTTKRPESLPAGAIIGIVFTIIFILGAMGLSFGIAYVRKKRRRKFLKYQTDMTTTTGATSVETTQLNTTELTAPVVMHEKTKPKSKPKSKRERHRVHDIHRDKDERKNYPKADHERQHKHKHEVELTGSDTSKSTSEKRRKKLNRSDKSKSASRKRRNKLNTSLKSTSIKKNKLNKSPSPKRISVKRAGSPKMITKWGTARTVDPTPPVVTTTEGTTEINELRAMEFDLQRRELLKNRRDIEDIVRIQHGGKYESV